MANTTDHGHDDHGSAHGVVAADIIPVNSVQDWLLVATAGIVLACLCIGAWQWAWTPLAPAG
jgi:hypothetical protein